MTHVDPNLSADANLPSDFGDFAALLEEYEATHSPQEGEIVSGRIIVITKDYVTIDIGYKSEGQVRLTSSRSRREPHCRERRRR